jgi:hypothetical protein
MVWICLRKELFGGLVMDPKSKKIATTGYLDTMHSRLREEGAAHGNAGCLSSSLMKLVLGMRRR